MVRKLTGIQTGIELQDHLSAILYGIVNTVNLAVSSMYDMQEAMNADVDVSSLEYARDEINQVGAALAELNERLSGSVTPTSDAPVVPETPAPVEVPVQWNTDGLEVFTSTGIERFEQEVQSTNNMLNALNTSQAQIAAQAAHTQVFPANMVSDLGNMQTRIQGIQDRITAITSNPLNMGSDVANAELERLRSSLDQAVTEQEILNQAIQDMDVSAANDAYLRLSQLVGETERYIRDNVDEQGRFNEQIQEGAQQASELTDMIKNAVMAYASIQSIGETLELSDELTQVTARLDMMNDMLQMTDELVNMVYAAAQDARGSFFDMADVVARFGNNAGDAFGSTEEVVAFANLIQKQMTIAGASTQEASNAMLQLSQALGSGVLRGDELNSIFEQAPNLIQSIADYLDVHIGQIREMASEGQLSADVVKAAIFTSADEINAKFSEMPMTWGQIWTSFQNTALIAFRPVLQRLNEIANSEAFQTFVDGAVEAMAVLSSIVLDIFNLVATVGGFIADNWSIIGPIIYGVIAALAAYIVISAIVATVNGIMTAAAAVHAAAEAMQAGATFIATAAQHGLNAALMACPLTWIILLIIALIAAFYAAVGAINHFAGTSISATGTICGAFMVALAFIGNILIALWNLVVDVFVLIYNLVATVANFIGNLFTDPIGAICRLFFDLADTVLGILQALASAIDTIFGSNLAGSVQGWRDSLGGWVDDTFGEGEEIMAKMNADDIKLDRFEYGSAWDAGYSFGEGIDESIANFDPSSLFGTDDIPSPEDYTLSGGQEFDNTGVADDISDIAGNTGNIADAMDITQEDLKYLRDIAEQEAVNRYTVAEVYIDQSGMQNTIKNGDDIDGFMSKLTDSVNEAVDNMAEGVHS